MKLYVVTGDTHGSVSSRVKKICREVKEAYEFLGKTFNPEDLAIIILGDVGLNFYLREWDKKEKKRVQKIGPTIYCVRGNHEERPEYIATYEKRFDEEIDGLVYIEPEFPNIRFLIDGNTYIFGKYKTLVLGGAYSIDKYYRLANDIPWFKGEQLSDAERNEILEKVREQDFDFVFSHTCPVTWMPTDLFLNYAVEKDYSTENWLEKVKCSIGYKVWCFGHFHEDRIERPRAHLFFQKWFALNVLYEMWTNNPEESVRFWPKSPMYYADEGGKV